MSFGCQAAGQRETGPLGVKLGPLGALGAPGASLGAPWGALGEGLGLKMGQLGTGLAGMRYRTKDRDRDLSGHPARQPACLAEIVVSRSWR